MKTEIKKKRRAVLLKIAELEPKRCKLCKGSQMTKVSLKCQCDAAVEIRNLGKELESLTDPTKTVPETGNPKLNIGEDRKAYSKEMVALAVENKIGYKMFQQRVKRYGWTELDAATVPLMKKRVIK